MRLLSPCRAGAVLAALAWLFPAVAEATSAQRTFFSVNGSDANPCSVAAPCRSFDVALANTVAGGEIVAVDSGGFGTISITKSIQIIVPQGVHAAIFTASGNAVTVNAGAAGDRALHIHGKWIRRVHCRIATIGDYSRLRVQRPDAVGDQPISDCAAGRWNDLCRALHRH
jgi:hypothetical protein